MLDEFRQRMKDRRGRYSLRKHIGRLRREGRLPQIGLAAVAVLTIGGLAFARCQNSITGPETVAETPAGGAGTASGSVATSESETIRENLHFRKIAFAGVNPCNGDVVTAIGHRHEKFTTTTIISPTDITIEIDHHMNDAFQGEARNNPEQLYTGSDVHKDRFVLGAEGVEHPDLTNEHLISKGSAPNWILHMHQKSKVKFSDPLNPTATFKAHASCPSTSECMLPEGCVDRDLELLPETP